MSKYEFLQILESSLNGEVPLSVITENKNYYNDYIDSEVRKGNSEESVISELGDPRLLARTIIDATPGSANYTQPEMADDEQDRDFHGSSTFKMYDLNKWYIKLLIAVIVIGVLVLVFTVIGGVITLIAPLIVPICFIIIIMWFMKGFR